MNIMNLIMLSVKLYVHEVAMSRLFYTDMFLISSPDSSNACDNKLCRKYCSTYGKRKFVNDDRVELWKHLMNAF